MIAMIRIAGRVNVRKDIDETFNRLKIMKKLTCTFIDSSDKVKMGMLKKLRQYVAYGKVSDEFMKKVIDKRGQIAKDKDKKYRGFCRLHPPIGGFKKSTKLAYPKGILGEHKDIDKLLERML